MTVTAVVAGGVLTVASAGSDRARVVVAQGEILEAYRRAQSAAVVRGGPVAVVVAADSIVVTGLSGDSAVISRAPGPVRLGVTLVPGTHRAVFDRNGFGAGLANVTHRLSRGTVSRQVVVSRLGRLRAL